MIARMEKEYQELTTDPIKDIQIEKQDNLIWKAIIRGAQNTVFENGTFVILINFTEFYPFKMPTFNFETPVFHPNVDKITGEICKEMLNDQDWLPTIQVRDLLETIIELMNNPNVNSVVNEEAAKIYKQDQMKYLSISKEFTLKYAVNDESNNQIQQQQQQQ